MDEIELVRSMSEEPPVPDEESRRGMAKRLTATMDSAMPQKRRRSRSALTVVLVAASLGVAGTALAHGLGVLWTDKEPIAVQFGQGDATTGGSVRISNPQARVQTAEEFAQTVAEFAPAIRLPEGHDFSAWTAHLTSDFDPQAWRREQIPMGMTFVARCQWGQAWIDSHEAADEPGMLEASTVLGQIGRSMDDAYTRDLAEQMRVGEGETVRSFVDVNCGYAGVQLGSPQQLDALVQTDLNSAAQAVLKYADSHGELAGFSAETGQGLAPQLTWGSYENSNPASPGITNLEIVDPDRALITQESESGTTFCVDIGEGGATVVRGVISEQDAQLLHEPGPGSNPQIECHAGW